MLIETCVDSARFWINVTVERKLEVPIGQSPNALLDSSKSV